MDCMNLRMNRLIACQKAAFLKGWISGEKHGE